MPAIQLDEKAVFNVARKIESPEVRDEYLRQVTAGDANFTERISMLLREFEKRQSFLEQPAIRVDETLHTPESMTDEGTQIGPYRLREPIGEGGMGVVYVADQEQPVRRKVALKLIKPGRDTKEVIARFAVERQALALMDHPNIARVLDAGTTAAGRPYFVMELVRGISITDYCDKAKLSTHERLRLFATVCQAVQHAHQKGIIHRDIPPICSSRIRRRNLGSCGTRKSPCAASPRDRKSPRANSAGSLPNPAWMKESISRCMSELKTGSRPTR